jgi:hypothetical protein
MKLFDIAKQLCMPLLSAVEPLHTLSTDGVGNATSNNKFSSELAVQNIPQKQ